MADQEWNWRFCGFQYLTGSRPVQYWYNGLPDDARDELWDTISYPQRLPSHLWKRPKFDPLAGEDVTEIRFETATHTYRIYGYYGPERMVYTFLVGTDKKSSNDRKGKREATERRKLIERQQATVHEFEF